MGHFTGQVKTVYCEKCRNKTVHNEILEDGASAAKIIGGVLTYGLSLLATGVKGKNNKRSFVCQICGTVAG